MFILWLLSTITFFGLPNQTEPCKLYGTVYIESSKVNADYIVYEEESEAFANMLVFTQENRLFADAPGLWYITDDRTFADFTIYLTPKKNLAHFTIHYIENESFAGCN